MRPQPRQISSKVVEHTATHGVSGRSGAAAAIAALSSGRADIELVPAFVAELFHGRDILFEDLFRFREGVDRARDAVLAQQVQDRVRSAVGVVRNIVGVAVRELVDLRNVRRRSCCGAEASRSERILDSRPPTRLARSGFIPSARILSLIRALLAILVRIPPG